MGFRVFWLLSCAAAAFSAEPGERLVESVLPSLAYGPACWSSIDLQNLGDRPAKLERESHRSSGALVSLASHPQVRAVLLPSERASYRLEIEEETGSAWVKVRERVPALHLSPVVAVSGHTECVVENRLLSTPLDVAYPLRNPWFSGDAEIPGSLISLVNTSEHAARASLCYSSGNLYSLPSRTPSAAELRPICSSAVDVQIPPFAARQFPAEREGSSHFSIKTQGEAVVLQMLRPMDTGVKIYRVDSTIKFGGEAAPSK